MPRQNLAIRLVNTARNTWDLGLTSFGGPPVHFLILKKRFVDQQNWITQETASFAPVSLSENVCSDDRTSIMNSSQYVSLSLDQPAPKFSMSLPLLQMVSYQRSSRLCSGRSLEPWECSDLHRG